MATKLDPNAKLLTSSKVMYRNKIALGWTVIIRTRGYKKKKTYYHRVSQPKCLLTSSCVDDVCT